MRKEYSYFHESSWYIRDVNCYLDFKDLYDSAVKHMTTSIPLEKEIFGANTSTISFH